MVVREGSSAEAVAEREPADDDGSATLTLTLSHQALGALGAYLQSGAARGLAFESALLDALRGGAAEPHAAAAPARCALSQRTLREVREFIEANLTRDINVEDIAQAAFLSPHHLGRSFHQATGQSLWQYVLHRRAQRARGLIEAQPQSTLADIAALCGFECYSQFIAAYRKTFGLTPGDYRRSRAGAQ
jgi:AraC family transcriptional regulator